MILASTNTVPTISLDLVRVLEKIVPVLETHEDTEGNIFTCHEVYWKAKELGMSSDDMEIHYSVALGALGLHTGGSGFSDSRAPEWLRIAAPTPNARRLYVVNGLISKNTDRIPSPVPMSSSLVERLKYAQGVIATGERDFICNAIEGKGSIEGIQYKAERDEFEKILDHYGISSHGSGFTDSDAPRWLANLGETTLKRRLAFIKILLESSTSSTS